MFFVFLSLMSQWALSEMSAQKTNADVVLPKTIVSATPEYPLGANESNISGDVVVRILILEDGTVNVLDAFGPNAFCNDLNAPLVTSVRNAGIAAASKTRFERPMKDGRPSEIKAELVYRFNPQQDVVAVAPPTPPSNASQAKVKSLGRPEYPSKARDKGVSGQVRVRVVVSEDGKVSSVAAISGNELLRESATKAACKSSFDKLVVSGKPVKFESIVTFNFAAVSYL